MERATSSLRRGSAFLWSIGSGYQQLNLIISELKNLKSHTKAVRDSQATVIQDIIDWACNDESRVLKEVLIHLIDLNATYFEIQTQFAEQITEFRRQFEMILEGEKSLDAARSKFADCEVAEQKAKKKLKKLQKKEVTGDIPSITNKIAECERQREIAQAEVTQKVQENEAVKLMRVKEGLLKLSEAYLALSNKCIYIFEAHREIAKFIPDVEDRDIHEVRVEGIFNIKQILIKARERVKNYRSNPISTVSSRLPRNLDPPPPYSPSPYYPCPPFNPYYPSARESPGSANNREETNRNSGNNCPNPSGPNARHSNSRGSCERSSNARGSKASDSSASGANATGLNAVDPNGTSSSASDLNVTSPTAQDPNVTAEELVRAMSSTGLENASNE